MAHLSKQLDKVARGWPTCLQAVAATALMVKEASKLTLGQPTTVYMPQQVQAVLGTKGLCRKHVITSKKADLFISHRAYKARGSGTCGSPVVKNLPASVGDADSIPGQGTKIPHV